jgi:hypothetical protein
VPPVDAALLYLLRSYYSSKRESKKDVFAKNNGTIIMAGPLLSTFHFNKYTNLNYESNINKKYSLKNLAILINLRIKI